MIRKYIQLLLYEVLPNTGGLEAKVIILYFFPGSNSNSLTWPLCQRNEEHKSTHVVDRFVECVFNLDRGLARAFFLPIPLATLLFKASEPTYPPPPNIQATPTYIPDFGDVWLWFTVPSLKTVVTFDHAVWSFGLHYSSLGRTVFSGGDRCFDNLRERNYQSQVKSWLPLRLSKRQSLLIPTTALLRDNSIPTIRVHGQTYQMTLTRC